MTNPIPEQDQSSRTRPDVTATYEAIPQEMRDRPQWVAWSLRFTDKKTGARLDKPAKVPLGANGRDANHITNRRAFATALAEVNGGSVTGVGYSVTAEDPFVILDMDHVLDVDTGEVVEPHAQEILDILEGSYYRETSPSGDGLRLVVRGKMPGGLRSKKTKLCEVYGDIRFLTMTGWEPSGEVREAPPGALEQVLHEFCGWDGTAEVKAADQQAFDFVMVADPGPPRKLHEFAEADLILKATWEGKRSLHDDDSSTEASLAGILKHLGFSAQEIVDSCRYWRIRRTVKPEKAGRRDLYERLLGLVYRDAVEADGLATLRELSAPLTPSETPQERRVEVLVALNQTLGIAPEKGVEGLWCFPGSPPTYALKAVGREPAVLGPGESLDNFKAFAARVRDIFRIDMERMKAVEWHPICQALLHAVVDVDLEECVPLAEVTTLISDAIGHSPPVTEESDAWATAVKRGLPVLVGGVPMVNLPEVLGGAGVTFQKEWSVKRMAMVLRSAGYTGSLLGRARRYWPAPGGVSI